MVSGTTWLIFAAAFTLFKLTTAAHVDYKQHEMRFHLSNWTIPGKKYFALGLSIQTDWIKAYQMCRYHGMRLATIDSEQDTRLIQSTVKSSGHKIDYMWTSGTNEGSEGYFYWMSTGRPLTYTKWGPSQPTYRGDEHCLLLHVGDAMSWHDINCSKKHFVLCEFFTPQDSIPSDLAKTPVLI